MFIDRDRKVVYFRVPKTGSTSLMKWLIDSADPENDVSYTQIRFLRVLGKDFNDRASPHMTLGDLIANYVVDRSDLENYKFYGTVRHPVDRFISRAYHMMYYKVNSENYEVQARDTSFIDINTAVKYSFDIVNTSHHMWKPQCHWLMFEGKPINRIFAYENLDAMAVELTNKDVPIPYKFRSEPRPVKTYEDLDPVYYQKILDLYPEDWELYKKIKGV